mgnify:CR=1 FL=1
MMFRWWKPIIFINWMHRAVQPSHWPKAFWKNLDRKQKWVSGTLTAPDGTVSGTTDCAPDELPVSAVRRGEVPGIHTIKYESDADSIIITHDAKNRSGFALGAVLAAEYTAGHTGFLGMNDLFPF